MNIVIGNLIAMISPASASWAIQGNDIAVAHICIYIPQLLPAAARSGGCLLHFITAVESQMQNLQLKMVNIQAVQQSCLNLCFNFTAAYCQVALSAKTSQLDTLIS